MLCLRKAIAIVYINDDEDDVLLFQESMADAGFVNSASFVPKDGHTVLEYLEAHQDSLPDALVMDINLPVRSGMEILEEIRSNKKYDQMPVVLVTGSEGYREMIRKQHPELSKRKVAEILIKPFTLEELTNALTPFAHCVEEV